MNFKTINRSNIKLSIYAKIKNISHNKASSISLIISKTLAKMLQFIFNLLSNNDYISTKTNDNLKFHDNYDITDTTELRLIASRRTFL